MPTYRLQLEYDGSLYHGWQIQPVVRTVQGEIERALALLTREEVSTAGAGRTDRGVHARGQVVSFRTLQPIDTHRVIAGIHGICGPEIRVRRLERAPDGFHARHDALSRTYTYRILTRPSALWRTRAYLPWGSIRLPALQRACAPLLGAHDFRSFANTGSDEVNPVCCVSVARWDAWEEGLLFTVQADHFLYKMVRNLVGTLLREAGPQGGGPAAVAERLERRERRGAAPPLPAHGLCLEEVEYAPPWPAG